ncbi:hypothetical protein SBA3_4540015 [Candidatus Sulfopaludibacter sp. SbA3]|nr:hypothetical protein SBA3_4540015 [Candidatus Sulfopaludibacter sp. SbA3]
MTKDEIILANKEFLFPAVFHYFKEPLVVSHAKNQYVWDADGNQYLDFFGGIVTVSVGHCNDQVNAKVHQQLDTLQHVSTVFANEPQAALAKKIASITPGGKLTKSFFTNSGTEANETAILAARCYTSNTEIVALRHAYHGRSAMAMTLTGQGAWRLGPSQAGIVHAHNAYCYRCPFGLEYPSCEVRCAQDMEELIRSTTGGRVAGFAQGIFPDRREDRAQSRWHLHQRRSANGLGTHRREVVWHRTMGCDSGHHHQRQGARKWQPHRADGGASGSGRFGQRAHHFDVRRQPRHRYRSEGRDRLHRRAEPAEQLR